MTLSRTYGTFPHCGGHPFSLDEELVLLLGRLAPRQQEHLVHLASWMLFEKAAQMIETLNISLSRSKAGWKPRKQQTSRLMIHLR